MSWICKVFWGIVKCSIWRVIGWVDLRCYYWIIVCRIILSIIWWIYCLRINYFRILGGIYYWSIVWWSNCWTNYLRIIRWIDNLTIIGWIIRIILRFNIIGVIWTHNNINKWRTKLNRINLSYLCQQIIIKIISLSLTRKID